MADAMLIDTTGDGRPDTIVDLGLPRSAPASARPSAVGSGSVQPPVYPPAPESPPVALPASPAVLLSAPPTLLSPDAPVRESPAVAYVADEFAAELRSLKEFVAGQRSSLMSAGRGSGGGLAPMFPPTPSSAIMSSGPEFRSH